MMQRGAGLPLKRWVPVTTDARRRPASLPVPSARIKIRRHGRAAPASRQGSPPIFPDLRLRASSNPRPVKVVCCVPLPVHAACLDRQELQVAFSGPQQPGERRELGLDLVKYIDNNFKGQSLLPGILQRSTSLRFQIFFSNIKNYDITKGRSNLQQSIEVCFL